MVTVVVRACRPRAVQAQSPARGVQHITRVRTSRAVVEPGAAGHVTELRVVTPAGSAGRFTEDCWVAGTPARSAGRCAGR